MSDEIARLATVYMLSSGQDGLSKIERMIGHATAASDWDAAGKWQRVRYRLMRMQRQRDTAPPARQVR